jgi:hypothetical protein
VVDRLVFYNNSSFDGSTAQIDPQDDHAIAVDKFALLPGRRASFANYTSYDRGLNGLMIDIRNLAGQPTLADFEFRVGRDGHPSTWPSAPAPAEFAVRPAGGYDGSDRLVLTWPDGAIANRWLQVRMKATASTGLVRDDVFYFGNAVGETGDDAGHTFVDGTDYARVRNEIESGRLIEGTDLFDFNRDGRISSLDTTIIEQQAANVLTALRLLDAPPEAVAAPAAAAVDHVVSTAGVLGDMNGDGVFSPEDLQLMAAALTYEANETALDSELAEDWNDDGAFTSQDLVFLFQQGHFRANCA